MSAAMPMPPPSLAHPAAYILGPWLIGTCLELILQGVISGQLVKYFTVFSTSDPRSLRIYVAFLTFLTVVKSGLNFGLLWRKCIINFGRLNDPSDSDLVAIQAMLMAFIALYVQGWYLHRLFRFSNSNVLIVIPVGLVLLLGFIMTIVAGAVRIASSGRRFNAIVTYYAIYLPLVMSGNIILTFVTGYLLVRHRKSHNVLPEDEHLVTTGLRLSLQTAAFPTILSIIAFAFSLRFPDPYPTARSQACIGVNMVLCKVWAFSVMWTLNARVDDKLVPMDDTKSRTFLESNNGAGDDHGRSHNRVEEGRGMAFGARANNDLDDIDDDDEEDVAEDGELADEKHAGVQEVSIAKPETAAKPKGTHPVRFSVEGSSTCASTTPEEGNQNEHEEKEFKGLEHELNSDGDSENGEEDVEEEPRV
ncbi:hypothetical protein MIND_00640400 [Mycena indigotica]|uniref:Uncharacterized protein n=1 Tax=Mycena indigotica TaxID=2126181 RepID=A0A8H6W9G0_9AGAR|nr:uncharacterized protein MIND_00640400 [Mycena indigotica]KAF7304089.1 hypothetical protein MIND_00640400 [Mycena indigotica]